MICTVLGCDPSTLLIREPEKVAARREEKAVGGEHAHHSPAAGVQPRLGRNRTRPPR